MSKIDYQLILEKLEAFDEALEDARDYASSAKDEAENAENEAYGAKNQADSAEDYAISAKNEAYNAYEKVQEVMGEIQNFMEEIREQMDGGQGERNLAADIRKWKPKVEPLLGKHTHAVIAKHFKISEFLVQCIEDDVKRTEAA